MCETTECNNIIALSFFLIRNNQGIVGGAKVTRETMVDQKNTPVINKWRMFLMGIHNAGCQNMHLTTRPATKRKKKSRWDKHKRSNKCSNEQTLLISGTYSQGGIALRKQRQKSANKKYQQEQIKWLQLTASCRFFLFFFSMPISTYARFSSHNRPTPNIHICVRLQ